jgi:DNA-binding NarL/FixJ family response regulator
MTDRWQDAISIAEEEPTRVLLVDDHGLFRRGLRELLEEHGLAIVGEAASGEEAVELAAKLAPDVVVMDLNMPGISGVEATRRLAERSPAARVVVLTISADDSDLVEAIVAGACGYVLKDAAIEQILLGIRAAASGESLISPRIAGRLLERVRLDDERARNAERLQTELSERELEVLALLARGKDNREIATELYVSPPTVKNHISSILAKLHMENRIQAAVYAAKTGLV